MAKRRKVTLTIDEMYRKPIGCLVDQRSLYHRLLGFVQWRRERNLSDNTVKTQGHYVYHFILWCEERGLHYPNEITKPILERYQRYLYQYRKANGEPLSSRTQNYQLSALQVWFKWLIKHDFILANPAADLELPRIEKRLPHHILTVEEVEQILNLPDINTLQGIRDRAVLELLWSTGMRRMEVAGLTCHSIDYKRQIVMIRQGKGKVDRVTPVGSRALAWLQLYSEQVRPQLLVNPAENALFLAMDGLAGLVPNGVTRLTSHYVRASGISQFGSCHLFRHAMATQMLENGADLRWIQTMLGHRHIGSTQIYTQVSIRALQAVHEATHPAQNGSRKYAIEDDSSVVGE
jgi:integrase/recombinase XerD